MYSTMEEFVYLCTLVCVCAHVCACMCVCVLVPIGTLTAGMFSWQESGVSGCAALPRQEDSPSVPCPVSNCRLPCANQVFGRSFARSTVPTHHGCECNYLCMCRLGLGVVSKLPMCVRGWVGGCGCVQKFLNVHVQLCFMVREIPLVCKMSQVLWSRPGMSCVTLVHSLTPTLPSPENTVTCSRVTVLDKMSHQRMDIFTVIAGSLVLFTYCSLQSSKYWSLNLYKVCSGVWERQENI